ncbi:SDR family NAD(P)-dependent oxidoreductase [Chloroflexota bacterium]
MSPVLENKVAIITGGGRGIGKAIALRYAEEGAKLFLLDINLEMATSAAEEIKAKGGDAVAMECDISDENTTNKLAEEVTRQYGRADILVNNAAVWYGVEAKPWDTWSVEEWDHTFDVNVKGTWLVSKAIAPLMVKQSSGTIINMASHVFKVPDAQFFLTYALTKSAVYTLTQCMARALGPSGITVNSIAPGLVATEASLVKTGIEDIFVNVIAAQSIKRRSEASDIVGTAVFLASKEADFISGQYIVVDGGSVMV